MIPKNKLLFNIVLLVIGISIYSLNRFCFKELYAYFELTILKNHLNDFLASIVVISIFNCAKLIENNKEIEKILQILAVCTVFSIAWELIIPLIKADSVADIKDVIAYYLGGLVYWLLHNTIIKNNKLHVKKCKMHNINPY